MKQSFGGLKPAESEQVWIRSLQALEMMKQGLMLKQPQQRILAAAADKPDSCFRISGPGYTLRLSEEDFLELYGDTDFICLDDEGEIDDQKDEDYYRWRSLKQ